MKNKWEKRIPIFCLIVVGILIYLNSFSGVFLLDDGVHIVEESRIRHLWPPGKALAGTSRPLVRLSFILNYAVGGLDVRGYHLFNIAVHILAALVLCGVVRRTLLLKKFQGRYARSAPWLALFTALFWLVHPVQTNSVTYISQRAEAMAALFYLLTIYCWLRGASSGGNRDWLKGALIASVLGMLSKPVAATAPLAVLCYDRTFLAGSFVSALKKRRRFYLGLAATWLILLAILYLPHESKWTAGFGLEEITPFDYAKSQPGVVLHYLKLSILPGPLVFHYQWPVARGLVACLLPVLPLAVLFLLALIAFLRRSAWGFIGIWFFLVLAPTSSFIPLVDLAFENRLYLALAAVSVLVAVGGYELLGLIFPGKAGLRTKLGVSLAVLAVLLLGVLTINRNRDYLDPVAIWADTVGRRPENVVARNNLGLALAGRGDYDAALAQYRQALRLEPGHVNALYNLADSLAAQGNLKDAVVHYQAAARLKPYDSKIHTNLGVAFSRMGMDEEAVASYREALEHNPNDPDIHNNLAVAFAGLGRFDEAVYHFERAILIRPDDPGTHNNLGLLFFQQRRVEEAIVHHREAVRLDPGYADAHNNLGNALLRAGREAEANRHFRIARELSVLRGRTASEPADLPAG